MFPLWSNHPAAAGLRVHLSNGLYANAVFDRLIGNWSVRRPSWCERKGKTMTSDSKNNSIDLLALGTATAAAARQIPPLWPLASHVAVNPFLGQTAATLAETGARLARVGGVPVTMPRNWYRDRIAAGEITDDDLSARRLAAFR
jgi:hypothetical protein